MNTNYSLLRKINMLIAVVILTCVSAYATTFTAVNSGSWSSAATWGVAAPSTDVSLDQIVIPAGITVTMDNSVTVSGAASVIEVNGTLTSAASTMLTVSGLGTISGNGVINVENIMMNTGANIAFTGIITADVITSSATTLQLTADMIANETLNITGGTLTVGTGGSFVAGNNSTIVVSGGVLALNGGVLGLSGSYNVNYVSSSAIAGLELSGSGLNNVTVNVGAGNTVTLSTDLTVVGMLTLQSGTLVLNGNDLTIATSGNVSASGSGSIAAMALSDITVNATGGLDGTLNFAGNSNTVGTLIINVGAGNSAAIGGSLTVDNALQLTSGTLSINGSGLTINGTVSGQGTLSGNASSNLSVTTTGGVSGSISFASGGQMLNNLTINVGQGNSVTIGTALTVNGTLDLIGGSVLNIGGQTLTIGAGGSITGNGSLSANASTNLVINTSGGIMVPVTINGGTIGGLTINVGSGNTVTLGADLTVAGSLNLQSGALVLSGNDLTVTGTIAAGGSGTISSSAGSAIAVNTGNAPAGSISFTAGANTVGSLNVGVGAGGALQLGSDVTVTGTLNFTSGSLDIGSNNVSLAAGGTITGSGSTSYIITGTNGTLSMQVTAGGSAAIFPVGTASNYLPANVELNSGSASGEVSVGVNAGVMANGTSGADISLSQPMVDATWFVHSAITSNLNMDISVSWETALEVNGFNKNAAYISHYHNGEWDASAATAATNVGGGMYSMTRTGITTLSPFAVFDQNTATSVTDVAVDLKFSVFPNPATDYIQVRNNHATTDVVDVDVTNAIGQTVATYPMTDTNLEIPVGEFRSGYYFIRFNGKNLNVVKKITKM